MKYIVLVLTLLFMSCNQDVKESPQLIHWEVNSELFKTKYQSPNKRVLFDLKKVGESDYLLYIDETNTKEIYRQVSVVKVDSFYYREFKALNYDNSYIVYYNTENEITHVKQRSGHLKDLNNKEKVIIMNAKTHDVTVKTIY